MHKKISKWARALDEKVRKTPLWVEVALFFSAVAFASAALVYHYLIQSHL